MNYSTKGLPVHHQLPEFTQTHVHGVSDTMQPSHPLSSPSPPAFNLSQRQGLFNESVLHIRWPKYWSFTFSISPSNNIQDWFPLGWTGWISLQSKGLSSLLQHHSSKASILRHSPFFTVQLSHPYMTTGKTIPWLCWLCWNFIGKVISLLFNMLSSLVTTFLPRSKHLFNFMAAITICRDFGAQKRKSDTVSTVSPSISHEVMGPSCHDLRFLNVEL